MMPATPERVGTTAVRVPLAASDVSTAALQRHNDALKGVCVKLQCNSCRAPATRLLVDDDVLHCEACCTSTAVPLPSIVLDAFAEIRSLYADSAFGQSPARVRVRAKRPAGEGEIEAPVFRGVSLNPNISPAKSVVDRSSSLFDTFDMTETRDRDEIVSCEAQDRVTLLKDHSHGIKAAKAAQRESSRQQKALGDRKYEEAAYEVAIEHYSAAIATNDGTSNLSSMYGNRSAAFFMMHRWADCIRDCLLSAQQDDIKQPHTRVKLMQRAAKAAVCLGLFEDAATYLGMIPESHRNADILRDLSRFRAAASQVETLATLADREAIDILRMLVTEYGEAAPLRLQLASRYVSVGEHPRALQVLDLLCEPSIDATLCRAKALYMQGFERLPEAFKILEEAANVTKDERIDAELRRVGAMESGKQTGNTLFASGKFAESIQQYTMALTEAEDVPNIRKILFCNRAASFKELKQYREGVKDCTDAIAIDPKFGKAFTRRARCLLALECFEAASRDFNAAIRLMGSVEEARNLEAELRNVERAERAATERDKDYYLVLELTPQATERDVKKQYKVLSLKWHPDKNVSLSDDEKKVAEHKFKKISEAYATLMDDVKRREYDLKRQRRAFDPMDRGGMDARAPRYNAPPQAWQRQPGKFW